MTNAPDFNLDAELTATRAWEADLDDAELDDLDDAPDDSDDEFVSGYAADTDVDGPDPEELTTGELDLAERHELRRVVGLRTDLEDITEVEYRQLRLERV